MKRELSALLALLLLLAGAYLNVCCLQAASDRLVACTQQAEACAGRGAWAAALDAGRRANAVLNQNDAYLHAVLRHEEINALSETLGALENAIVDRDPRQVQEQAQLARLRVKNILRRERVTLGSVF